MITKEVDNPGDWNEFLVKAQPNTFLQSWEWGQVQKKSGEGARYVGFFENGRQVGAALVIIVKARRGRHLLIPHGPIFTTEEETRRYLPDVIACCKNIAHDERAIALRIAPLLITSAENTATFTSLGFRPAPLHIHTELTWMLDINKSEQELLSGMRKTTRHAIKKGTAVGITIDITDDRAAHKRFFPLYSATRQRHGFVPFSKDLLQYEMTLFGNNKRMYLCFARHNGHDVAAGIFIQFGDTVFYHHGASISSGIPASQLLQWSSIQEAQRRGATRYNFWGIAPPERSEGASPKQQRRRATLHPFAGITTFKKGFGGYAIDYLHAQDMPLSPQYWQMWLIEKYRKWKRGF